jgi:hypothetical protein
MLNEKVFALLRENGATKVVEGYVMGFFINEMSKRMARVECEDRVVNVIAQFCYSEEPKLDDPSVSLFTEIHHQIETRAKELNAEIQEMAKKGNDEIMAMEDNLVMPLEPSEELVAWREAKKQQRIEEQPEAI